MTTAPSPPIPRTPLTTRGENGTSTASSPAGTTAAERDAGRLTLLLERAGHYLPAQAALETFVHHNTLHAFQHLPFHEALACAAAKLGNTGTGYLPEAEYRKAYESGRILPADLERSLSEWAASQRLVDRHSENPPPSCPSSSSVEAASVVDPHVVARVILLQGIGPETRAGLAWRIAEQNATKDFEPTVSSIARGRIEHETTAWLHHLLERREDGGAERVCSLLVGEDPHLFTEQFGGKPTTTRLNNLLTRSPNRLAIASLWQACRRARTHPHPTSHSYSRSHSQPPPPPPPPSRARVGGRAWFLRDAILEVGGNDPNDLVHPILILLSAAFLDRGQSHWSMPDREEGFFTAFCRVLGAGHAVRPSWLRDLGRRIRDDYRERTSESVVSDLLAELGVNKSAHEEEMFIERSLLQLPGWAGMFQRLQHAPKAATTGRSAARVRLIDFLAVRLVLDVLALRETARQLGFPRDKPLAQLREHLHERPLLLHADDDDETTDDSAENWDHNYAWPLFLVAQHLGLGAPRIAHLAPRILETCTRLSEHTRLRIWHEAYEASYRNDLLRAIDAHVTALNASSSSSSSSSTSASKPPVYPRFQIVTCIDERAEGFRRHFEELSASHMTFGAAGFFNLAIAYRGMDDPSTFPLCPVVVTPKHEILEEPVSEHASLAQRRSQRRKQLRAFDAQMERASKSIVWGPIVTAILGFFSTLPLLATVFAPFLAGRMRSQLSSWFVPTPRTRLSTGFTIEEKAARVGDLLVDIGLTKNFARLVVICGHDSSSVNNPHFAAYSCGACGGRSGGPNARLFARMANRKEVREKLRTLRGLDIPDTTVFIGAVHDTCAERVVLMDVDELPIELMPELTALQAALDDATKRHAHERCRRFATAPRKATYREAHRHVEARSYDLSQARPELGHASNAACVVGRRALTRGLFLDRRVFLHSYDRTLDDDVGSTLERILLAVGPVGAGINLEYFFSTTDNEGYGAGTKLPHNVSGLVGVMNGASSDLRTGLPKQMIEIHEPIRLQLVVETSCEVVEKILARSQPIAELVENEWVRLIVFDNSSSALWIRRNGAFERWVSDAREVPTVARSQDWYRGKGAGHLKPARVVARADDDPTGSSNGGSKIRFTIGAESS